MVSFKNVWPGNEFERFVVFSTTKLKTEGNYLIKEVLEVFYFLIEFIVVGENF